MRTRLRTVGKWLGRGRDLFPPTLLGLVVAGLSVLCTTHYGLGRIDLILLVVGIVGLSVTGLCVLLTVGTSLVFWWRLRGRNTEKPLRLECGYAGRTGFSLGMPWFVPFVRTGWGWLSPDVTVTLRRRGLRVHEEILPRRRAERSDIVRRMEVSDVFGLCRIRFDLREMRPVTFVPSVGALKQMQVVRSMAAGDQISHPDGPAGGERIDIRRYGEGDPIRFILWKVFARTRELVIRSPERAIGPSHQTVAYLVTSGQDEAAAGASRVAVDTGALGEDWILGVDGREEQARSGAEALDLLVRSGENPEALGGTGLASFLRDAPVSSGGRALVFVPSTPGPWLDRVLSAMRAAPSGPSVEFVVCTDGIDRGSRERSTVRRLALREAEDRFASAQPTPAQELGRVCKSLSATRARVLVLDRAKGRVYSEAHQRSLEAA